jgi:dTDP-glucose pyrophosphorylase
MRAPDESAALTPQQSRAADTGAKAMIPVGGARFLDYVLSALADGGITEVCLVVGPDHHAIRDYYASIAPRRLRIYFAIQQVPRGTADALLCAAAFAASHNFLVLNSDNYYPVEVYHALVSLGSPGVPAFEREALIRGGNISRERVASYALMEIGADSFLKRILEKPDAQTFANWPPPVYISMNLWSFDPQIFDACREVAPSSRGELELPQAVDLAISSLGMRLRALPVAGTVLDLSSRADIAEVAARLADLQIHL